MPASDFIGAGPTSGLSRPNHKPPTPPQLGEHPWMADHERSQYFEQNPRQAFNAFSPQFGKGQQRRGIMSGFGEIMDTYLGDLGRNVQAGNKAPEGGFADYLAGTRGYDEPFDFEGFFKNRYPGASEASDARHNPSIRYLL